jgi:putative ABC transport system ATP-binding protein
VRKLRSYLPREPHVPEHEAGKPAVRAVGVTKRYTDEGVEVEALRGVDLEIAPGELVAIVGPSGCGKTTLLNCLAGLDEPTDGTIEIEGVELRALGQDARARHRARRMGFVFQSFNLLPVLDAAENVEVPLLAQGVGHREARERAIEALGAVGLAARASHRPSQLSGGQQQRVAIARSLVAKPAIVWADEPTGNLDSETAQAVMDLLHELHREGLTLILVTHDNGIASGAGRRIVMRDGQIVLDERQNP